MFAVVATGGKQYRVSIGESIEVEKLPAEKGERVEFDRVLLVSDGDQVTAGTPAVAGAIVVATVSRQFRGPKLVSFRYKSKQRVRVKHGHRQDLTQVFIRDIVVNGESAAERSRSTATAMAAEESSAAGTPADEAGSAGSTVSSQAESAAGVESAGAAGAVGVSAEEGSAPTARKANADELETPSLSPDAQVPSAALASPPESTTQAAPTMATTPAGEQPAAGEAAPPAPESGTADAPTRNGEGA